MIVTDENNLIEATSIRSQFDFENSEPGISRVYSISYIGVLRTEPGVPLDSLYVNGTIIGLSRNFVEINRVHTIGGTVHERTGSDLVTLCINDATPDSIVMRNTSEDGNKYVYIVTDEMENILNFSTDSVLSFAGAPEGVCRIYGASYSGTLSIPLDSNLVESVLSTECYELSSNYVTLTRTDIEEIDPVFIDSDLGDSITFCVGDRVPDSLHWTASFSSQLNAQKYVITDNDHMVLAIQDENRFDFEGAPDGICLVWAVSYSGTFLLEEGENLSEDLVADHCFQLSEQPIVVIRNAVYESMISTSMGDDIEVCTSDSLPDVISFQQTAAGGDYAFLVTASNDSIVAVVDSTYDFSETDQVRFIRGISFHGSSPFEIGDIVSSAIAGCFLLSDNTITVSPASAEIDMLTSELGDSILVCAGNDIAIPITTTTDVTSNYINVLTKDDTVIAVIDSAWTTAELDVGQYSIFGIAFVDENPYTIGTPILESFDGCYDVSDNHLFIEKKEVIAPNISSESGEVISFCTGDELPDSLFVTLSDSSANSAILITDDSMNVLDIPISGALDFEGAPEGICLVWGLNYSGDLLVEIGDRIMGQNLSTECFRLSEDAIQVIRIQPDGGTIISNTGDQVSLCPDESYTFDFDNNSVSGATYIYLVMTEDDLIAYTFKDTLHTDSLSQGTSQVIGLSYDGELPFTVGDSLDQNQSGCFSFSKNIIIIEKIIIDNPVISSSFGDTTELCVGDGISDFVDFSTTESQTAQTFIITDDSLNILDITADSLVDFDSAGFGTCLVWALNYTGSILIGPGVNVTEVDSFSSGCFALSANAISIIRSGLEPAGINSSVGDSVFLCSGESTVDRVSFMTDSSEVDDELSVYFIVGPENQILDITMDGVFQSEIDLQGEAKGLSGLFSR